MGPKRMHGPHQEAQKSTSVMPSPWTVSLNSGPVMFLVAMSIPFKTADTDRFHCGQHLQDPPYSWGRSRSTAVAHRRTEVPMGRTSPSPGDLTPWHIRRRWSGARIQDRPAVMFQGR